MSSSKKTIQSARIINEPIMVNNDGKEEPYIPKDIMGHRGAYAASLHLLFKHVADFHVLMIEILSEKYGIPADDMIRACHEDERFQNMVVNPTIHSMQYFDESDVAKHVEVTSSAPVATEPAAPVKEEPPAKPKKVNKIKKAAKDVSS
jgi:hypothetical protein